MEFSRQGYWSGLPFASPGDHPDPEIEPGSPALQADSLPTEPPGKPYICSLIYSSIYDIWISLSDLLSSVRQTLGLPLSLSLSVLVTQLCLTLCNPMDCSPPGLSLHGIL